MSAGSMIAANVLMSKALQPLDLVVATWKPFVQARTAFRRLEKLLEEFPERQPGAKHQDPLGEIRLEALSATVEGREQPILQDINVVFPAGRVVSLSVLRVPANQHLRVVLWVSGLNVMERFLLMVSR